MESDFTKILDKDDFRYRKITIEEPLIENDEIVKDKKGNIKPDSKKRDVEYVPEKVNLQKFFEDNFLKYKPQCWIDHKKEKIGYEIGFNSYFHQVDELVRTSIVFDDIKKLDAEIKEIKDSLFNPQNDVWRKVFGGDYPSGKRESGVEWIGKFQLIGR